MTADMSRRALLAGATAAAALPTPASAAEALTIITPGGFGIDFMEAMNAVAGGHLAAQGFAPTLLGGNGQAAATNQVLAGQAMFTRTSALDLFLAAAGKPPPLVSIATLYQASTFHVISRADKPVADAAALAGRTVGVVSVKGTTELLLDLMLSQARIPRERVARVAVGNSPGALRLIDAGRIDCFIASISVVARLQADAAAGSGAPVLVWSTDRYAPMPSQCWIATRQTISQPETVVRFLRALAASCHELLAGDFDTLLARMARQFDIPGAKNPAELRAVKEATTKLWLSQGEAALLRNVPALWSAGAAAVASAGIAKPGDPASFYDNGFLDRI
jgi:ABC-type nitrate/sulfonate/bicarbonate transport system substrate-binding protein